MQFKNKCDEFLQTIATMRENAIVETIKRDVQIYHEPFKAERFRCRDEAIAVETQAFNEVMAKIKSDYENNIRTIATACDSAVAEHEAAVRTTAQKRATEEYDKFILQMSTLVDNTKID